MRIGKFPWGSLEGVPECTLGIRPSIPNPHSKLEMTVTRGPGHRKALTFGKFILIFHAESDPSEGITGGSPNDSPRGIALESPRGIHNGSPQGDPEGDPQEIP